MSTVMVVVVLRHGPGVGDGKWINSIEAEFILVAVVGCKNYDRCNGLFILILGVHGLKGTMGPGTGVSGPGARGPEKIHPFFFTHLC